MNALAQWLEERTGVPGAIGGFLNEEIPASSGWAQAFGSVALFLLLVQVFTGILLAINYAPTPGDAYNSLQYILSRVHGGRLIHGLHHWGASMMIVVVVLHMLQVFLYGAYRKPREATWIVGVALLLVVLGFGLTGYLLPWDNRAYWGTVVTVQIASHAPLVGDWMRRLLGADTGVGVLTFSRFYSLHTLVLPLAAVLLAGFHLFLVRRHGVAPAPGDDRPAARFYPAQAFRDTLAIFATFAILFLAAVFLKAPLDQLADPTDTSYVPRPDWYFLFLFQLLKFFSGAAEQVVSVLLPSMAVMLLFAAPFLDRGKLQAIHRRTGAMAVVAVSVGAWGALTAAAYLSHP